jgi:uncharacterized protein involved in exopolysaccharide biosynthesis
MASNDEFIALDRFYRILRFWWVVVLLAVIGGIFGYVVHRTRPELYEAKASFLASIDFNKIDFKKLEPAPYEFTQYDEDISLVVVQVSLNRVIPQVVTFAQQNGLAVDNDSLMSKTVIERNHAYWLLKFRDHNPDSAQKVVNYWAKLAYADLQTQQKAGDIPPYIFFDLVQLAELPKNPTYLQTNQLVFAGTALGLVVGIVLVNLPFLKTGKER